MDLTSIQFSDGPMNLAQRIYIQRIIAVSSTGVADYEAIRDLIVERTSLTMAQTLGLEDGEIEEVLRQVYESAKQGVILQSLGRSLDERSNQG